MGDDIAIEGITIIVTTIMAKTISKINIEDVATPKIYKAMESKVLGTLEGEKPRKWSTIVAISQAR